MFPVGYFTASYFPGTYWPPVSDAVAPAPSPAPRPMGPAGGPLPGERAYDDKTAKRHRARLLREDDEILELIVQITTKGLLD